MMLSRACTEPFASQLAESRAKMRKKHHISFDCYHCVEAYDGETGYCRLGHKFPGKDGLRLLAILRGRSAQVCHMCKDYDDGEGKEAK